MHSGQHKRNHVIDITSFILYRRLQLWLSTNLQMYTVIKVIMRQKWCKNWVNHSGTSQLKLVRGEALEHVGYKRTKVYTPGVSLTANNVFIHRVKNSRWKQRHTHITVFPSPVPTVNQKALTRGCTDCFSTIETISQKLRHMSYRNMQPCTRKRKLFILWPWAATQTYTFELVLVSVKVKQQANLLSTWRSFSS